MPRKPFLTPDQLQAVHARYKVFKNEGTAATGMWVYQPHDFDGSFELWSEAYPTFKAAAQAAWREMQDPTSHV